LLEARRLQQSRSALASLSQSFGSTQSKGEQLLSLPTITAISLPAFVDTNATGACIVATQYYFSPLALVGVIVPI